MNKVFFKKVFVPIFPLSILVLIGIIVGNSCKDASKTQCGNGRNSIAQCEQRCHDSSLNRHDDVFDEDLDRAARQMLNELVHCVALSHLENEPFVACIADFSGPNGTNAIKDFTKSFTSLKGYPKKLKGCFASLDALTLHNETKGVQFAYAKAMNTIAETYRYFHNTYTKMLKIIKDGVLQDGLSDLYNELLTCLNSDVRSHGMCQFFDDRHEFFDSREPKLGSGTQMARLMSTSNYHGVYPLMDFNIGTVWIKLKNDNTEPSIVCDASHGFIDRANLASFRPIDPSFLNERGAVVSSKWLVDLDNRIGMPDIEALPNGEPVRSVCFNPNATLIGPIVKHGRNAVKKAELKFGQLLFSLFKGHLEADFFDLTYIDTYKDSENDQWLHIQLNVKNEAFRKLNNVVQKGAAAFAEYLGNHIEAFSKMHGGDLFVVPNVDELKHKIVDVVRYRENEAPSSSGMEGKLVNDDLIVRMRKAILNAYGAKIAGLPARSIAGQKCSIEKLGRINHLLYTEQANITFLQRLCACLANKLCGCGSWSTDLAKISLSTATDAGSQLLNAVSSIIDSEVDRAIVKKQGGKYLPTNVTEQLLNCLEALMTQLAMRNDAACITYATIKKQTGGKFDIQKVHNAINKDYNKLLKLFTVGVDHVKRVLQETTKVNYADYFEIKELNESHYPKLDAIRSSYMKLKAKKNKRNRVWCICC